jgi:hypothetical protein
VAQQPTPGQINAYQGAQATGTGVICDALGNPRVIGANMPAGAANGYVVTSDANGNLTPQPANFGGVFGTGADGPVTFDGTTTVLGLVPSGSVYTLTRDIHCTSITINSGVTLKPANFRIFCRGTITNSGTISSVGNNAAGGTAGANIPSQSLSGGRAGGNGGTGVSGTGANGSAAIFGNTGGNGGAGTSGAAGSGGTTSVTLANARDNVLQTPMPAIVALSGFASGSLVIQGGAGGGGGGSDASSNAGGGGGGGGGTIALLAWAVVNNGTISANGGNGAAGTGGNAGGGGGGAGGLVLAYTLSAWTAGTATASAGTHGNGSGTGSNGADGGAGLVLNVVVG